MWRIVEMMISSTRDSAERPRSNFERVVHISFRTAQKVREIQMTHKEAFYEATLQA
jgi:hypothetical protein